MRDYLLCAAMTGLLAAAYVVAAVGVLDELSMRWRGRV